MILFKYPNIQDSNSLKVNWRNKRNEKETMFKKQCISFYQFVDMDRHINLWRSFYIHIKPLMDHKHTCVCFNLFTRGTRQVRGTKTLAGMSHKPLVLTAGWVLTRFCWENIRTVNLFRIHFCMFAVAFTIGAAFDI